MAGYCRSAAPLWLGARPGEFLSEALAQALGRQSSPGAPAPAPVRLPADWRLPHRCWPEPSFQGGPGDGGAGDGAGGGAGDGDGAGGSGRLAALRPQAQAAGQAQASDAVRLRWLRAMSTAIATERKVDPEEVRGILLSRLLSLFFALCVLGLILCF
jgi:hypothetical protein